MTTVLGGGGGGSAKAWSEKIASLVPFALIAPQPRHAHRRAQLPRLRLLLARDRERTVKIRLRFGRIRHRRLERDFPGHTLDLGLAPPFFRCFHCRYRFANTRPSIIELTEFRISSRQI
jgi:hypothetical protein